MRQTTLIVALLWMCCAARAAAPSEADFEFFETRIRPILAERCFQCHSSKSEKLKGGLRLDSRAGLLKGGETGLVVIPGDPQKSRIIEAIEYQNVDLQMPPKRKLSESQISDLKSWVKLGAPWPAEPAPPASTVKANAFDLQARKAKHWAWQPIRAVAPPAIRNHAWARDPIDQFILAKLEDAGLSPAPQADRRTLIRQASFDLTGLPPTPAEVEAFLNDPSSDAFAKVVDRLLASPHFGEQWARHWMDLVRYAETYGHEFDYPIANAWQYRDYLIRAFNADVPYDQLVKEHVAGDLLPQPRLNPYHRFNESIIATGFWFFTEQIHAPVDVRQHQCDRLDNQIDVFGKAFLGLTIACARCHDHKFDAIAQQDYYALSGYLESSRRQDAMLDPDQKIQRAAQDLRALRREASSLFLQSLPKANDVQSQVKEHLFSTARVAVGPKVHPSTENDQLKRTDFTDPLSTWVKLKDTTDVDFNLQRQQLLHSLRKQRDRAKESESKSILFKNFSDGSFSGWFPAGWAFGQSPTRAGQIEQTSQGFRPSIPGLAHSGAISHKLRGVLRSPTFILTKPQLLYHIAGSHAQVRLIVDQYMMDQFSALLFAGATFKVDTGGDFIWHRQAQDVGRYIGHRAYIEIIDDGDGWVALDQVRFADADTPTPSPQPSAVALRVLEDPSVNSVQALAGAYSAIAGDAIGRFREGKASADDCRLINALLDQKILTLDPQTQRQLEDLSHQMRSIDSDLPSPMYVPAMADGNGFDQRILIRGNPRTPGAPAPRHFLQALDAGRESSIGDATSGRLQLARQLVDPANPLTGRVMVNRLWHHLMGRGIVASVDNFGVLGEPPSHPQLLDHLADRFMRDGWSMKRMIRSIMLSSTYQMSSGAIDANAERIDPSNILLHRANVRRLPAESIRDEILALSGRLNAVMFGPPVDVYLTGFVEGRGRPASGPLDGDGRRSIYLAVRRNFLSPMLLAFDMPTPFSAMGRRSVSNVPAQALTLMNDPFVIQQSQRWAKRVLQEPGPSPKERLSRMFQQAFARSPSESELAELLAFIDRQGEEMGLPADARLNDPRIWSDIAHALINAKEFIFLN